MINTQILKFTKTKELIFAAVFTGLAVLTPMVFHFIGGAALGKAFLPMHVFVLAAGLILGWQAGLAVGILTPLISFSISGMPTFLILPFVLIEVAAYGFFAGFLKEKASSNIWLSLVSAMFAGRAILLFALFILPTKLNTWQYVSGAIISGWPGILLQILAVPFIVKAVGRFLENETASPQN